MIIQNFFGHLHTINKHRFNVTKLCFKCGMYYQGLTHDLSKYSPTEFISSVKYFQGFRSPIDKEREILGYSNCWLHHKGRNKHHYEYWIDRKPASPLIRVIPMPDKYILESVLDKIAASKVYGKEKYHDGYAYNFFSNGYDIKAMEKTSAEKMLKLLEYLKDNGEKKALIYYKNLYKQIKSTGHMNI